MKEIWTIVSTRQLKEGDEGFITDPRFSQSNLHYFCEVAFSPEEVKELQRRPSREDFNHLVTLYKTVNIVARKVTDAVGNVWIWCPGCKHHHILAVDAPNSLQARWEFNGDFEKPTFKPSLLVQWNEGEEQIHKVCHSFITAGQIEFLNDCTHELAGQTVSLPSLEEAEFQI